MEASQSSKKKLVTAVTKLS